MNQNRVEEQNATSAVNTPKKKEYFLISYAEKQHGSLFWEHYNDVIAEDPVDWLVESLALDDRNITLTMIQKINENQYEKLRYKLG